MYCPASWLQQFRTVLKPLTSCSSPTTTTLEALRPAVVLGTWAHDWANGAAAGVASAARALPAPLLVAVADVATIPTAIAAPTRSQRRLCIDSLRLVVRRELDPYGGACSGPTPEGVPHVVRRRAGSLVRTRAHYQRTRRR